MLEVPSYQSHSSTSNGCKSKTWQKSWVYLEKLAAEVRKALG